VDLAGQLLVLGVSDHSIELLLEVQNGELADRIRLWQSENSALARPEGGLLETLTTLVRGTKLSFWHEKKRPDFSALLQKKTASTEKDGLGKLLEEQKARLQQRQRPA
jgi:hypothetical protein